MIESDNLRTASLYINNQLLSRGLLHDGQSIDFTRPGESDGEVADTMGRIMAVVNDLILRRDRDAEHRERLSTTLRTVRAESLRQTNDLQRLQEKNVEAQRKACLSDAADAALRVQLKTAEATIHKLKEEAARTKILVGQTRAACATEVRKRDRQIDGLKKAVSDAGRARGTTKNASITTINVTGEIGSDGDQGTPSGSTATDGYDLRMETNAFLAELAKGLSEENETLLDLIQRTTQKLTDMSGWDKDSQGATPDADASALPANVVDMSNEIDAILDHLRTILTNPSFVPIEEVVVREDEIHRLRHGWEKMETRWKEAVHLLDGWRRRMQLSGRPVNMEELKMGLRLSPVRVRDIEETSQGIGLRLAGPEEEVEGLSVVQEEPEDPSSVEMPSPAESLHLVPAPDEEEAEESDAESSIFEDDVDMRELDVEEPNVEIIEQSLFLDSPPLPPQPHITPLADSYSGGNRGRPGPQNYQKRPGDFTTIVEEKTWELSDKPPVPPPHVAPQQSPKKQMPGVRAVPQEETPPTSIEPNASSSSLDSILLAKPAEESASKKPPTATRSQKQAPAVSKSQGRDNASSAHSSKQPVKSVTRSKSRSRADENEGSPTKTSRTRPIITKSAPAATATTISSSLAPTDKNTDTSMPPPRAPTPSRSPRHANSRLPLPRSANLLPPPQQSPLTMATIAAKLAASEREADAARVRAKLKAARLGKRVSLTPLATSTDGAAAAESTRSARSENTEEGDPVKKDIVAAPSEAAPSDPETAEGGAAGPDSGSAEQPPPPQQQQQKPRKRERRTSKVASRRRSTLNPWELETLIQGSAAVAPTATGA